LGEQGLIIFRDVLVDKEVPCNCKEDCCQVDKSKSQKADKVVVVTCANARVDPWTVVIKSLNTSVTG
jgi:hypothetical protein